MLSSSAKLVACCLLALPAFAQEKCEATGVDYTDGGTYSINSGSSSNFTFATKFSGCDGTGDPTLHSPGGDDYSCTEIDASQNGQEQVSTCDISFSQMASGNWSITITPSGANYTLERTFRIIADKTDTVTSTVTPTIIVGYTSTPVASTTVTVVTRTLTQLFPAETQTTSCTQKSITLTYSLAQSTATVTSGITRTSTSGSTTERSTIYGEIVSATCHIESGQADPSPTPDHVLSPIKQRWANRGYNKKAEVPEQPRARVTPVERDVARPAATTITFVETTYTYASTFTTVIPTPTKTETTTKQTTRTLTPPPSTVCGNPTLVTETSTVTPTPTTQTGTIYATTTEKLTLWIITTMDTTTVTNSASATACWRSGGVYY